MARYFKDLKELSAEIGREIGVSAYMTLTQEKIDAFANATGDNQWIHVDTDRAKEQSPFGSTIGHGFLTLSLASPFLSEIMQIRSVNMGINYGTEKVRFISAVPVNSQIRMRLTLANMTQESQGWKIFSNCQFEVAGIEKPACVATIITLLIES